MEGRVLLIEDDPANAAILREHLNEGQIKVEEATTGQEGIEKALRLIPEGIVISTTLPDMAGIEVVKQLRGLSRTRHIFMMMLADENMHHELLNGLEVGVDDFVPSPFDPDEVTLRVRNALRRATSSNRTDPITGLPAGPLLQEQLRFLVQNDPEGTWCLIRFRVAYLDPFREVYGFMAAEDLLRGVARIFSEVMGQNLSEKDFLAYGGRDDFIVITQRERFEALRDEVTRLFAEEVGSHYNFMDREQGYILYEGQKVPLAELRVRMVTPETDGPFYDIRSLTEALGN